MTYPDPHHAPANPGPAHPAPAGPGYPGSAGPGHHPAQVPTRPVSVTIACVLLWLYSAAMVAGGVLLIVYAVGLERPDPWSTIIPFVGEMLVVLIIGGAVAVALAGAVVAAFAIAAYRGARAARWVLAVILALGVIVVLVGGAPLPEQFPIGWRLLVAAALVVPVALLFLPGASAWLTDLARRRSYPAGPPPSGYPGHGHAPGPYQPVQESAGSPIPPWSQGHPPAGHPRQGHPPAGH